MKKIIFVRHGKAEDEYYGINDFERSLTTSGKKITSEMAVLFAKKEKSPGLFISSPAFRAIETALLFAISNSISPDSILLRKRLYANPDLQKLTDILSELDPNINTVTLFGHNPSFSNLADILSSDGCDGIPKSGVAGISFNVNSWNEIKPKTGTLEYFLKPE